MTEKESSSILLKMIVLRVNLYSITRVSFPNFWGPFSLVHLRRYMANTECKHA